MSDYLKSFFDTGKKLLDDTKKPRALATKKQNVADMSQVEADPHKNFIKRTISEKPKKAEVVKDIKKFIEMYEAEL